MGGGGVQGDVGKREEDKETRKKNCGKKKKVKKKVKLKINVIQTICCLKLL